MPASVKSQTTRRARKALATRRRILEAAETLFTRDGYATTTIAAIADQADVAVQTIYAAFGTKRAVLSELLAVRVVGDDDATPLKDRAVAGAQGRTSSRPVRGPRHRHPVGGCQPCHAPQARR